MKRGDVVEVDWHYTDMSGSKVRPAVVAQADFLNGLIDDTILVQVTSTRHSIPGTEVVLDPGGGNRFGIAQGVRGFVYEPYDLCPRPPCTSSHVLLSMPMFVARMLTPQLRHGPAGYLVGGGGDQEPREQNRAVGMDYGGV
jgi:hypothetical protein